MPLFSMFVQSPPAATSVSSVYGEERAFGPFGQAAGEVSPDSGFSEALWLEVFQAAPGQFRTLHAVCDGSIRVAGVQSGFPGGVSDSPIVLELTPGPRQIRALDRICRAANIETPRHFLYHGLDPASVTQTLANYFANVAAGSGAVTVVDVAGNVEEIRVDVSVFESEFLTGRLEVYLAEAQLGSGSPLGVVSDKSGKFLFGIEARTTDPIVPLTSDLRNNYLDPVVLFQVLASAKLSDGSDAIAADQIANSWMEVVTRDRVLLTFRDEWNSALVSAELPIVVGAAGQSAGMRLTEQQFGTIVAGDGWGQYTSRIGTPPNRKLTPVPSDEGATDTLTLSLSAPAHRVIASIRPEDWFHPTDPPLAPGSSGLDLPLFTEGNLAKFQIDGLEAFAALAKDLIALDDPNPSSNVQPVGLVPENFALLADWHLDIDLTLVPSNPSTSVRSLLQKGVNSPHHLIVRAMIWGLNNDSFESDLTGSRPADDIASLDTQRPGLTDAVATIRDPVIGAFHWKFSVVRNRHGTFAQIGGIDLNTNRLDSFPHAPGGPQYHDVHCRIQGPAVRDIVRAFKQRYSVETTPQPWEEWVEPTTQLPPDTGGPHMIQIARTASKGVYPWAPQGDRTIWATLRRAIQRARRYIYIEEQYLVAAMFRDELIKALNHPLLEIVIVIPDECDHGKPVLDFPQSDCNRGRSIFLNPLLNHPRVQIYSIGDYFIHSKVTIIDDVFANIGSANMNRRGLTHDSEINAFVLDGQVDQGARRFARDLRVRLWAEHLGSPQNPSLVEKLKDIDTALELMRNNMPANARYSLQNPGSGYPIGWDDFIDPDGS